MLTLAAHELETRAARVRLVITDVDGVLTDNTVYVSARGEELLRFSRRDGMGVERLRTRGIATAIITRENSEIVRRRAEKLGITLLALGVQDKREHLPRLLGEARLELNQLAYIGDDVNDLGIIDAVATHGLTAAPADAMPEVRDRVHLVTAARGGEGAFRELAEHILGRQAHAEKPGGIR